MVRWSPNVSAFHWPQLQTCPVQGHVLLRGRLQPGTEQAGGIKTSHMGPSGTVWWALAEPSSSDLHCGSLLSACSPSIFSLTCWALITSFLKNLKCSWYSIEVASVRHTNSQFLSYTPFIVILKYWVYSLYCAIYSCGFLYTKYFKSLSPLPFYFSLPSFLHPLVTPSFFSISESFSSVIFTSLSWFLDSHLSDVIQYFLLSDLFHLA